MRLNKEDYYLEIARTVALRSTCLSRRYGVVIVKNDSIIATGYNGAPRGEPNCCDVGHCYCRAHQCPVDPEARGHGDQYGICVAVHAEQNAMINAPKTAMIGATMYIAGLDKPPAPCNTCNRMIKNSGLREVVGRYMPIGAIAH